jgi:hypothetical protein
LKRFWPLIAVLLIQAALLFPALDLLPVWSDELFTLSVVHHDVPEILKRVQADIHPPLYYLLLHVWPGVTLAGMRAFSALWALLGTLLLDLLWTRAWRWPRRLAALAFFGLSPCLLLYGRMARSYSMQATLAIVALWAIWRYLRGKGPAWAVWASLVALLYTHYVPGLALLAAFALVGWRRRGLWRTAALTGAISLAYLPWLWTLAVALERWSRPISFSASYRLTESVWLEHGLKIGFGAVSLALGETFSAPFLLLVPAIAVAVWFGARRAPGLAALLVIAAGVGYLGVARWVSYPFIPARLLWLLPPLALAVGATVCLRRRWSCVLAALIGLSTVLSGVHYFRQTNYLNKGYAAPLREIAATLNAAAGPGDLILVDVYNTDAYALAYYLECRDRVAYLFVDQVPEIRHRLALAHSVWVVRNNRDISPRHITSRMEDAACRGRLRQTTAYMPYEPWLAWILARLLPDPPTHFYQLTGCAGTLSGGM